MNLMGGEMFQTNKIVNSWLDGRLKIQSIDNSELKEVIGYYPNGALRFRHFLRKNAFEGRCCSFFEDGSIHSEANYKDGKLSGIFREYNPNNGTCGYEG